MRQQYKQSYRYRLTNPPKALLKARLDNIAIVPASMLGLKALWQTAANTLPQGGVLSMSLAAEYETEETP